MSLYKEQSVEFPDILMGLLESDIDALPGSLRRCLVQCLMLIRKKKLVSLEKVLTLFFRLFRLKDKALRELLYDSVVGEIKRANTPHRNNALNKTLQNFMFSLLHGQSVANAGRWSPNDSSEAIGSHKALQVMVELYRRNIWNDAKTVNVVAEACTARISYKVTVTALNFFLGRCKKKSALSLADESESESEEESEDEGGKKSLPTVQEMMYKMQVAGATKARKAKMKKYLSNKKRLEAEKKEDKATNSAFSAIHLLNDPYGFVEKLFGILQKSTESFEFKLLLINVISRVIGAHNLIFLDLYSFLLRFIQPHQKNVTQVLAYTAQASHDLVPPDVIVPVVKAIANNFVADHCRNEVIAAGLNGLTQICARCPLAMDAVLLQDLANYKGYHDKAVMMAARSLIALYREKNPELLHRKDRGKDAAMAIQRGEFTGPAEYGRTKVASDIDGANLLHEPEADEEDAEDGWVECSSDSEEDEGEEDFEELGSDEIEFSDADSDEDEDEPAEQQTEQTNLPLAAQKIFTPEDFALLKRRRLQAAMNTNNSKRKHQEDPSEAEDSDEADGPTEIVRPSAIQVLAKKPKADYAARMESIKAGREGRMQFGSKKGKDSRGSKTNAEKSKHKNAIMMAHKLSVRLKKKRSFTEVQQVQRKHVQKQKLKRK